MRKLILHNKRSPGDCLVMTGAIESLHRAYPSQFVTDVRCCVPELYANNPYVTPLENGEEIVMEYPAIDECNQRPVHFLAAYCEYLSSQLGVEVPSLVDRPALYLSSAEREPYRNAGRYVVINGGFKTDFTAKKWHRAGWQKVIDHYAGKLAFVSIGEEGEGHVHPEYSGSVSMIGQTDVRTLIRICYHSLLGIGPVTFLGHMFAALGKPYILLNNREPDTWIGYKTQRHLNVYGQLPCANWCWRSRVVAEADEPKEKQSVCELPVSTDGEWVPQCQMMITPEKVIETIEEVLNDGQTAETAETVRETL